MLARSHAKLASQRRTMRRRPGKVRAVGAMVWVREWTPRSSAKNPIGSARESRVADPAEAGRWSRGIRPVQMAVEQVRMSDGASRNR